MRVRVVLDYLVLVDFEYAHLLEDPDFLEVERALQLDEFLELPSSLGVLLEKLPEDIHEVLLLVSFLLLECGLQQFSRKLQ